MLRHFKPGASTSQRELRLREAEHTQEHMTRVAISKDAQNRSHVLQHVTRVYRNSFNKDFRFMTIARLPLDFPSFERKGWKV